MKNLSAMLVCDFYKIAHREMYPQGTETIYSTWTPRSSRIPGVNEVVVAGHQVFIKEYLIEFFNENFFNRDKKEVVDEYSRIIKHTLGVANPPVDHIEALHDLGYLPLEIKALPEGTVVPVRTPTLTIQNTKPEFFKSSYILFPQAFLCSAPSLNVCSTVRKTRSSTSQQAHCPP